jgi:hypothetical protein
MSAEQQRRVLEAITRATSIKPRNHPTLNHIRLERNMETLLDEAL